VIFPGKIIGTYQVGRSPLRTLLELSFVKVSWSAQTPWREGRVPGPVVFMPELIRNRSGTSPSADPGILRRWAGREVPLGLPPPSAIDVGASDRLAVTGHACLAVLGRGAELAWLIAVAAAGLGVAASRRRMRG
jgi:hypothetical protein